MTRFLCVAVMAMCLAIPVDARADIPYPDIVHDLNNSGLSLGCRATAYFSVLAGPALVGYAVGGNIGGILGGAVGGTMLAIGSDSIDETCEDPREIANHFAPVEHPLSSNNDAKWTLWMILSICENHPDRIDEEICKWVIEQLRLHQDTVPSTPLDCESLVGCTNALVQGDYGVGAISVSTFIDTLYFVNLSTYWDWTKFYEIHHGNDFSYQYELQY